MPVFRRLYEACMERGLPIGCAPNVHVSLVLLPEECRWLSPRRYPFQTLKLKAMARLFARRFEKRCAALAARAADTPGAGTSASSGTAAAPRQAA